MLRIIEDNVYEHLFFDNIKQTTILEIASKQSKEHNVFLLSSFAKSLIPGLRIGYLVASPCNINKILMHKIDFSHSSFLGYVTNQILKNREQIEEQINILRKGLFRRKEIAINALSSYSETIRVNNPNGGYFLWIQLPPIINTTRLLDGCAQRGVSFLPGHDSFIVPKFNFIRLSYSYCEECDISKGLGILLDEIKTSS